MSVTNRTKLLCFVVYLLLQTRSLHAQDTALVRVSADYLSQVHKQVSKMDAQLDKRSAKALQRLQKQEAKIRSKLAKTDSTKAKQLLENSNQQYKQLEERLTNAGAATKKYIPSLDTLATSIKFLQDNPQLLSTAKQAKEKIQTSLDKVKGLQTNLGKAEDIKTFLQERRQYLKDQLQNLGFAKELKKINKEAYYYAAQLNEYKELLKDHKKATRKAIELLSKTKLFKDFMRKHSQLASLFRLPGDPNDPATLAPNLAGLQTRAQVNNLIQQQLAAGGPGAQAQFRQNMQDAQSQLNQLKEKLLKFPGSNSTEGDMPEGFKPNNQRTKSFFKGIELGVNIQSQKSNGYFPVTSDIGVSAGYKLNDKSIVGLGMSYKVGWGESIRKMKLTHQGMSIRSFVDWKIKGSFWLTGGYELNYRPALQELAISLPFGGGQVGAWQESGLLGVSKQVSLKTKFFKQTKLQLLWDFLSYRQVPKTPAMVFRVGYSL